MSIAAFTLARLTEVREQVPAYERTTVLDGKHRPATA